ncbi:ABC transporter substrate-binding protein, partial [Dermatophilus congolensis]
MSRLRASIPLLALTLALTGALTGCSSPDGTAATPQETATPPAEPPAAPPAQAACIDKFDPTKDYFPDKVKFSDAENVNVEYFNSYKVVTVRHTSPGGPSQKYVLTQCGAPEPKLTGDLATAQKITIPVKKAATGSTGHVPPFQLLNQSQALAGVTDADKISGGKVKDAIKAGKITKLTPTATGADPAQITTLKPDLFISSTPTDPANPKLRKEKIPVVSYADWFERTPLGRAEWTKFTALFLDAEAEANTRFERIASDYRTLVAKALHVSHRPAVLLGTMTDGKWKAPGRDNYVANEILDAGGTYVLEHLNGTEPRPLDFEMVLTRGAESEHWLAPEPTTPWKSLNDPISKDARIANLPPVKKANVWTFTKRINEGGGNDYWQSGAVRPDLVLADLIAILHPELMPSHQFT